jgi:hypothetical protein
MAKFTIIGFTEAELGFVLAALFAALAGHQAARQHPNRPQHLQDSLRLQSVQIEQLRREADSLRALSSKLTPYCSERGETSESVAQIVALSGSRYLIDGVIGPIDTVLSRLAAWVDRGRELGCRFRVDIAPARGMGATTFIAASERVGRYFYLRRGR